jgi:plasmid stabilization system protein ParE
VSEYDRRKAVEMRRVAEAQEACADALEIAPHLSEDEREIAAQAYRKLAKESLRMATQYENMGNQDG